MASFGQFSNVLNSWEFEPQNYYTQMYIKYMHIYEPQFYLKNRHNKPKFVNQINIYKEFK